MPRATGRQFASGIRWSPRLRRGDVRRTTMLYGRSCAFKAGKTAVPQKSAADAVINHEFSTCRLGRSPRGSCRTLRHHIRGQSTGEQLSADSRPCSAVVLLAQQCLTQTDKALRKTQPMIVRRSPVRCMGMARYRLSSSFTVAIRLWNWKTISFETFKMKFDGLLDEGLRFRHAGVGSHTTRQVRNISCVIGRGFLNHDGYRILVRSFPQTSLFKDPIQCSRRQIIVRLVSDRYATRLLGVKILRSRLVLCIQSNRQPEVMP